MCIAYLDGLADPETVEELYQRLDRIDIDGILDANYVNALIRDQPWSPFRSTGYTERPDVVSAKLVAAPMLIIVAISGITSLLVPKMNAPILHICFAILSVGMGLPVLCTSFPGADSGDNLDCR